MPTKFPPPGKNQKRILKLMYKKGMTLFLFNERGVESRWLKNPDDTFSEKVTKRLFESIRIRYSGYLLMNGTSTPHALSVNWSINPSKLEELKKALK